MRRGGRKAVAAARGGQLRTVVDDPGAEGHVVGAAQDVAEVIEEATGDPTPHQHHPPPSDSDHEQLARAAQGYPGREREDGKQEGEHPVVHGENVAATSGSAPLATFGRPAVTTPALGFTGGGPSQTRFFTPTPARGATHGVVAEVAR